MLKQRIITAAILAAIFVAALFYLPAPLFSAFVAMITLIGAWEWSSLADLSRRWQRVLYVVLCALVIGACAQYLNAHELRSRDVVGAELTADQTLAFRNLLVLGGLWWAVALLWVQSYPHSALLWRSRWMRALMGLLVLVPAWVALSYLRILESGQWLVLLLIAIVASADIGGYFTGRRWGRRKLAPHVSPGKTWEGFAGGVAANLLLAVVIGLLGSGTVWMWLVIILPTSLVSVLGDLLESMLKRHRGVKDSSALLPGHGGVLDRVDSLTSAAPIFALALLASGWPLS